MRTEIDEVRVERKRLPIVYSLSDYLEVCRMTGEGDTIPDDFVFCEEPPGEPEPEDGLVIVITVDSSSNSGSR